MKALPLIFLLFLLSLPAARATTLLALSLEDLVAQSELIFTASVAETVSGAEDGQVYTWVTLRIEREFKGGIDTLGAARSDTLTLRFLGGSTAAGQLEVVGQYIPAQGDRGLYFVEDAQHAMVNPLTGWSQGHFPLYTGPDGVEYLDLRGHPDYAAALGAEQPLAGKLRALGVDSRQIDARFPASTRFPLADFIAAIDQLLATGD